MKSLDQMQLAWQRVVENQITVAQQDGSFDNLPGMGRPLEEIMDISDPYGWIRRAVRDCRAMSDGVTLQQTKLQRACMPSATLRATNTSC